MSKNINNLFSTHCQDNMTSNDYRMLTTRFTSWIGFICTYIWLQLIVCMVSMATNIATLKNGIVLTKSIMSRLLHDIDY